MSTTNDRATLPPPTNWDGTPLDVATIPARKLYGNSMSIEIGQRGDRVAWQTVGPRGGLSVITTMTPEAARDAAYALVRYAVQAEGVPTERSIDGEGARWHGERR